MRHYATCCHAGQLAVLADSMRRHCGDFHLHVLAWDWDGMPSPDVSLYDRNQFLGRNPGYEPQRLPGVYRNMIEQVCTVRWQFICDLMEDLGQPVTLVDGDIMFWSSPEPMFDEIGRAGCAVSPHSFAPAAAGLPGISFETHRKYGLFNGGWVYFADLEPARWMAAATRRWSYSDFLRHPDGRVTYGDQGWLELLQAQFGAHVIEHPGVNVGPWNIHARPLRQTHDGALFFGGRPLVSYHYSSFRRGERLAYPAYAVSDEQARLIYGPYEQAFAQREHCAP